MPRSAGTYTLPANSLAVSGTTISSTYFNAALNDIAAELTASVPRDGTGAMSAGLQGYSGTASAPSYTYSADATSGTFRKADNQIGMSIDGSEVGYWDLNGWNPTSATASQLAGYRNVLINGSMQISQRNGTTGTTTADDVYALDRWYALTQTGTITVTQQVLGEDGTPYHCRLTQAQAVAQRMGMAQIVEAANSVAYRGKGMTLGARIRCSSSQAIRYAVLEWTGTADTVTSDVVNSWTNATFTAGNFFNNTTLTVTAVGTITPSANTWTSLTALNATISSSCTNLIVMIWTEATAAQNVTLDISRVQLEPGNVATPFEWRPLGAELALCQRYLPAFVSTSTNAAVGSRQNTATTNAQIYFPFRTTARVAPTGVTSSGAGDFLISDATGTLVTPNALVFGYSSTDGAILAVGIASGQVAGAAAMFYAGSSGNYILFTGCEL